MFQIEGELAMMLDGQEDDSVVAHEVEDEMVAHHVFPQVIVLLE